MGSAFENPCTPRDRLTITAFFLNPCAGSIAYCGSLIQWLRDNLGILKTLAESEALASKVLYY